MTVAVLRGDPMHSQEKRPCFHKPRQRKQGRLGLENIIPEIYTGICYLLELSCLVSWPWDTSGHLGAWLEPAKEAHWHWGGISSCPPQGTAGGGTEGVAPCTPSPGPLNADSDRAGFPILPQNYTQ